MKKIIFNTVAIILLFAVPAGSTGFSIFRHYCKISGDTGFSLTSSELCNCDHDTDVPDEIPFFNAPGAKVPETSSCKMHNCRAQNHSHKHIHTKAHCEHKHDNGITDEHKSCCSISKTYVQPIAGYFGTVKFIIGPTIVYEPVFIVDPVAQSSDKYTAYSDTSPPEVDPKQKIISYIASFSRSDKESDASL